MRGPGKGNTNNPNGRPKGSINARSKQWETLGAAIISTHAERFNKVLRTMDDEEFVKSYTQILGYFKPKLASTTIDAKLGSTKPIVFQNGSDEYEFDKDGNSIKK